jgi:serine/threonine-protein kinase
MEVAGNPQSQSPNSRNSRQGWPLKALIVTAAIAAASGVGIGLALRWHRPMEAGSTPLHSEQSFPPRSDFSGSDIPNSQLKVRNPKNQN